MLDDRARALIPVNGRIIACERAGIRRRAVILRGARGSARVNVPQRAHEQIRTHDGQPVKELTSGLEFADRRLLCVDHITGVHLAVKVHRRHAGHRIAVEHRPLDGRCPAILRQQRAVHIDRAVGRGGKQLVRQDAAVGHDDENVRLQALQRCQCRAVTHLFRLKDRQTVCQRDLLDRARLELHAAVFGLVRLRKYTDHVKVGIEQTLQRHGRKIRRAHENDAHGPHLFDGCSSSSGASIRVALSMNRTPSR